ncbi:hypothetical protein ACJIZ3_025300 [Penstemon smallii]|uniref:G-patch domain-containing protein n=1 Tax=Penstemon smallii TaxID=265156 RepID=A0ABD3TUB0_9LAMI
MGGYKRKKLNKSKSRGRRMVSANRSLFVEGGVLSDWSSFSSPPSIGSKGINGGNGSLKHGLRSVNQKGINSSSKTGSVPGMRRQSKQSRENGVCFVYPQENAFVDGGENQESNLDISDPTLLIGSEKPPIVAYVDEGHIKESQTVEYIYDYTSGFTLDESSNRGMGFSDEVGTTSNGIGSSSKIEEKESVSMNLSFYDEGEVDADAKCVHGSNAEVGKDFLTEDSPGYLLIGGTKIYTQDISDEDDVDPEKELIDEESYSSSVSEDDSETSDWDGLWYSGSDIDDEMAADYLEGIGGVDNIINVDQLVGQIPDLSDDYGDYETPQRFGEFSYQEAPRGYVMKNFGSGRKYRTKYQKSKSGHFASSSAIDGLMLVKEPTSVSWRRKHHSRVPQSWPLEARKSKRSRKILGVKRKHNKKTISTKHRDRMMHCSVNLQKKNLIIGDYDEDEDISFINGKPFKVNKHAAKKVARDKSNKKEAKKNKRTRKEGSYAADQPLSFISSGILNTEKVELGTIESNETKDTCNENKSVPNLVDYGAFEMHTTGFGSKMMAKMGYVEGGGLGKEGQGMAQPIEVFKRPKSLGLGARVPETSDEAKNLQPKPKSIRRSSRSSRTNSKSTKKEIRTNVKSIKEEIHKFGSFEKHTKGFGSKMMAKMGFLEGNGLGKDSQGMVDPLVSVRRPKSRGLGARS